MSMTNDELHSLANQVIENVFGYTPPEPIGNWTFERIAAMARLKVQILQAFKEVEAYASKSNDEAQKEVTRLRVYLENIKLRFDDWEKEGGRGFPEGSMAWAMWRDATKALEGNPFTSPTEWKLPHEKKN